MSKNTSSPGKTVTKKFRRITLDMLLASTSLTRSSKESSEVYLQRITHLHLQNKKIMTIEGLDLCTSLKVLYLYDNQIEKIANLEFASLLQYLYLQNNRIKDIPNLNAPNLMKLYLDDNEIPMVSGLNDCYKLAELHLARQRLPSYTSIQFDPECLHCLANSLEVLEISGCGVLSLSPFLNLYNLRKFFCRDNMVTDMGEVESLVSLPQLVEANFLGNPCCKTFKYRDVCIGASTGSLRILDEVPILSHQQVAIKGLMIHRRQLGNISKFNPSTESYPEGSGGQFIESQGFADDNRHGQSLQDADFN